MTILAYPCIGGPLAGKYATSSDFTGRSRFLGNPDVEDGQYVQYAGEYHAYNFARMIGGGFHPHRGEKKAAGQFPPSMVFVHQSMLKPLKRASER